MTEIKFEDVIIPSSEIILCKDCRFANIPQKECNRNPPDNGRPANIKRYLDKDRGCFQGERKEFGLISAPFFSLPR